MADANKKKGNPVINFIKRYFFTGLLISAPIGATIYITIFIVEFIAGLVPDRFNPNGLLPEIIGYKIPGLELIIAFLSFILIGLIFSTLFGKAILGYFDNLITRIPLAGNVYKAINRSLRHSQILIQHIKKLFSSSIQEKIYMQLAL